MTHTIYIRQKIESQFQLYNNVKTENKTEIVERINKTALTSIGYEPNNYSFKEIDNKSLQYVN